MENKYLKLITGPYGAIVVLCIVLYVCFTKFEQEQEKSYVMHEKTIRHIEASTRTIEGLTTAFNMKYNRSCNAPNEIVKNGD
jgi:hypothetical protein